MMFCYQECLHFSFTYFILLYCKLLVSQIKKKNCFNVCGYWRQLCVTVGFFQIMPHYLKTFRYYYKYIKILISMQIREHADEYMRTDITKKWCKYLHFLGFLFVIVKLENDFYGHHTSDKDLRTKKICTC